MAKAALRFMCFLPNQAANSHQGGSVAFSGQCNDMQDLPSPVCIGLSEALILYTGPVQIKEHERMLREGSEFFLG